MNVLIRFEKIDAVSKAGRAGDRPSRQRNANAGK